MIDISKVFTPSSEPISQFFRRPGLGFYIPLYQRPYSWDKDNIDQLMEDICAGVSNLTEDDDAIHFMGTSILLQESNPNENIEPLDNRALPTRIDNVIDGQQRISTIALLACELYKKFSLLRAKLSNTEVFADLKKQIDSNNKVLLELFSVDIDRGEPTRKPIIIRGSIDQWTLDGSEDENYKSDIANYLAKSIRAAEFPDTDFPKLDASSIVGKNVRRIQAWLTNIEQSESKDKIDYPSTVEILKSVKDSYLWAYERKEIKEIILNQDGGYSAKDLNTLKSLVLLLAFSHYFLDRCCFSIIEPTREHWAFDMFQSLNATGTPLTAIETFLPLVVNDVNKSGGPDNKKYKGSTSESELMKVEDILSSSSTNKKAKITNEYINFLSLIYEGSSKASQFSIQRTWLNNTYTQLNTPLEREGFVKLMGMLGSYWSDVLNFDANKLPSISGLHYKDPVQEQIGSLCIQYLNDANHKMANTILFFLYRQAKLDDTKVKDFFDGAKLLAAFFTIWRAVKPNTGLDDVYKKLLKGDPTKKDGLCYSNCLGEISIDLLKKHFKSVLEEEGVLEKKTWLTRASTNLTYANAAKVCRFALFISSHDSEPDKTTNGLMCVTIDGVRSYLEPKHWVASDFSDIEHIAPRERKSDGSWDPDLYVNSEFERIGNLTLLPTKVNVSASNKGWPEKLIYYKHLAETNEQKLHDLAKTAKDSGITLKPETLEILRNSKYSDHMRHIVAYEKSGVRWNLDIVTLRSERICNILWDRIIRWFD